MPESPGFELEAREPVGNGARAGQAVALEVHPEEAERCDLLRELRAAGSPARTTRRRPGTMRSRTNWRTVSRIALLLVVEQRVDREEVARIERRRLGGRGHTLMVEDYRAGARWASASASHGLA